MNSSVTFWKKMAALWIGLSGHSEGGGRCYSDRHCGSPTVHSLFEVGNNGSNFGQWETGWWFQTFFSNFHPHLGKWSNLRNTCQMGWNHQLGKLWCVSLWAAAFSRRTFGSENEAGGILCRFHSFGSVSDFISFQIHRQLASSWQVRRIFLQGPNCHEALSRVVFWEYAGESSSWPVRLLSDSIMLSNISHQRELLRSLVFFHDKPIQREDGLFVFH